MRFAPLFSRAVGLLVLCGSAASAAAQGVVTLPTAMPPSGTPCPCAPGTPGCQCTPGAGCQCAPGTTCQCVPGAAAYSPGMYAPITSPITTWDPYAAPQTNVMPIVPGTQPTVIGAPCPPYAAAAPPRTYRFGIFGEYLYWRAGDSTTTDFAVPINGGVVPPDEPTIPVGPIATLNPDFESGFRVGGWWQRTCESQIGVSYTHYDSQTEQSVAIDPADNVVLLALVVHPATVAADFFFTDAAAQYDLELQIIDVDYRHQMCSDCVYRVNYVAGVRFLHYDEEFRAAFTSPARIETVMAENHFDGFGLRGGFEGEWGGQQGGIFGYGKFIGGAVAGRLRSAYIQESNFDGIVVTTEREDDRIVPTLEVEVGVGWRSRNQRWRLSAGYNITALFNLASTNSLIDSIQTANYHESEDTVTFDGLVARVEFLF